MTAPDPQNAGTDAPSSLGARVYRFCYDARVPAVVRLPARGALFTALLCSSWRGYPRYAGRPLGCHARPRLWACIQ
jgi:hypothetical protein